MTDATGIEWARNSDGTPGSTFNPWTGCTKVSPACDNCYAESWAKRSGHVQWGNNPRRRTTASNWYQPIKWDADAKKRGIRRRVFCASLADVFDNQVDDVWRHDLWDLIHQTPNLDWLLLTKRPQNMRSMMPGSHMLSPWPNIWIGTTVENQQEANRRIPHLIDTPAVVRFLSCEPLLDIVYLLDVDRIDGYASDVLRGVRKEYGIPYRYLPGSIDWVIAGGESGPNARPSNPEWFRSLRDQCAYADVPFFFKQWGDHAPIGRSYNYEQAAAMANGRPFTHWSTGETTVRMGKKKAGRLLDGELHDAMPKLDADK